MSHQRRRPAGRWGGARFFRLLLPLLLAPFPAVAGAALSLELLPAWEGLARSAVPTELGVRLLAAVGGPATVMVATAAGQVQAEVMLEAGVPRTLHLPLLPPASGTVQIEAALAGTPPQRYPLTSLQLRAAPLVAVVQLDPDAISVTDLTADRKEVVVFRPGVATLPHLPQAYATVIALVLDEAALAQLAASQWAALQDYLAGCGRLLAGVPPAVAMTLRQAAGCGGRFVRRFEPGSDPGEPLRRLLAEPSPPALPGVAALTALAAAEPVAGPGPGLLLFWLGYAVGLVLLAYRLRQAVGLLLVPLVATGLLLLAWSRGGAASRLLSWAELDSGATIARYTALWQVTGQGRGVTTLTLPAPLGLPLAVGTEQTAVFVESDRQPPVLQLPLTTRLLVKQSWLLTGTCRVPAVPTLTLGANGPLLLNEQLTATAAGLLGWDGRRYDLPPLAPGERWSPPAQAETWGNAVAEQWLRARSIGGVAVLLPFTLADAGLVAADGAVTGWLLIHPAAPAADPALPTPPDPPSGSGS